MSDKDLEAVDDLGEGDGAVVFPVLDGLDVVDEDDEIFVFALVVDFGLVSVSAGHGCGLIWFDWEDFVMVSVVDNAGSFVGCRSWTLCWLCVYTLQ